MVSLNAPHLHAETARTSELNHLPSRYFSELPVRFREESDLPWAEMCRRPGTGPHAIGRWRHEGLRPNALHMMTLPEPAEECVSSPNDSKMKADLA